MINFPGLNLSFKITPIAFAIFGVNIYWYAILIVTGIVLALVLAYNSKEKFGISFDFLLETLIYAILVGVIGARIYYVMFNLEHYEQNPLNILNLRDGGLAIFGGLIAGAMIASVRCKKYKINPWNFLDYLVPFVALGQSVGRWGNFFNQEAYGTETTNFLRMGIATAKGYKEVHPTFLYESICTMTIFVFLRILQKHRKFRGEIIYLYLFLYSGCRMLIEGIRIDSLMIGNVRVSQILSCAIFVISGIMLLKNCRKYIQGKLESLKC